MQPAQDKPTIVGHKIAIVPKPPHTLETVLALLRTVADVTELDGPQFGVAG